MFAADTRVRGVAPRVDSYTTAVLDGPLTRPESLVRGSFAHGLSLDGKS
jgi:hypothetical protein